MDFERVRIIPKIIKSKCAQLRKLNDLKRTIRSADPSQMRVSGGPQANSRLEEICADIDALELEIQEQVKEYKQCLRDAEKEIDETFTGTEQLYMRYRYLCGMSYKKIAQEMNYTVREIYYIRNKVCTKFHLNS